jgi:hypothetical protein
MFDGRIAAVSVLGVLLVAGAVVFLPGGQNAGQTSSITAVVTSSDTTSTYTQGHGTIVSYPACAGSAETYGNMTFSVSPCVSYGFPSAFVRNATLDTRQVLPFVKTAYEYHLVYFAHSKANWNVMYAVLNVTGSQVVTGNYTTGYRVSYVGNKLLNVTVFKVVYQHYDVVHVSAYALPDRNASVAYTPQQIRMVDVALSDANVTSLMSGSPYYVEFVGSSGNGTTAATDIVQLYQVNGAKIVGAFVNPSLGSVVTSFTQLRGSGECWPGGIVVTDPWGEAGFGCSA